MGSCLQSSMDPLSSCQGPKLVVAIIDTLLVISKESSCVTEIFSLLIAVDKK